MENVWLPKIAATWSLFLNRTKPNVLYALGALKLHLILLSMIILLYGCKVDESQKANDYYDLQDTTIYGIGPSNPNIIINGGDASTDSMIVSLSLSATDNRGVIAYSASESSIMPQTDNMTRVDDNGTPINSDWTLVASSTHYSDTVDFELSTGTGYKTVYVWFADDEKQTTDLVFDSIFYDFKWTVSDTGQTASYTDTVGEDSDYSINPPNFTNNGDGTVTDHNTNLMWQRVDSEDDYSWTEAAEYCSNLTLANKSNWRVPTRRELISIVNYGASNPAIDTNYFPYANSSIYWTTTIFADNASDKWVVDFDKGEVNYYNDYSYNRFNVRCVRNKK